MPIITTVGGGSARSYGFATERNNPPPTFLTHVGGIASSTDRCTVSFTAAARSVIVLFSGSEYPARSITSITGLGLTWNLRAASPIITGHNGQTEKQEIWYAINTSNSQISGNITAIYSGTFDDQAMLVASFSGCFLGNPWSRVGPYYNTGSSGNTSVTFSTSQKNSLGLTFFGTNYYSTLTAPAGWNLISNVSNSGATLWEFISVSQKQFTTLQTNQTVTDGYVYAPWIGIADSLVS